MNTAVRISCSLFLILESAQINETLLSLNVGAVRRNPATFQKHKLTWDKYISDAISSVKGKFHWPCPTLSKNVSVLAHMVRNVGMRGIGECSNASVRYGAYCTILCIWRQPALQLRPPVTSSDIAGVSWSGGERTCKKYPASCYFIASVWHSYRSCVRAGLPEPLKSSTDRMNTLFCLPFLSYTSTTISSRLLEEA